LIRSIKGKGKDLYALVGPGSTQLRYQESHPIIQILMEYCREVYSFDLPGHGINQIKEGQSIQIDEALDQMFLTFKEKIQNKKLILVGFSLGGLILLKLWKKIALVSSNIFGCFLGCGFKIDASNREKVEHFFSPNIYSKFGWEEFMLENHGKEWKTLLFNIKEWLQPYSNIFLSISEINEILGYREKILFILSKRDQSFSINAINYGNMFNFKVNIVRGDHFSYFSPRVGLKEVKKILLNFLETVNQEDL
jgi:hypothetical protein